MTKRLAQSTFATTVSAAVLMGAYGLSGTMFANPNTASVATKATTQCGYEADTSSAPRWRCVDNEIEHKEALLILFFMRGSSHGQVASLNEPEREPKPMQLAGLSKWWLIGLL